MIDKLICFFKGHRWFHYVGHTGFPSDEHAMWCGRCGRETTEEAEKRERIAQAEAMFQYAQRRSQYY